MGFLKELIRKATESPCDKATKELKECFALTPHACRQKGINKIVACQNGGKPKKSKTKQVKKTKSTKNQKKK